jgi:flagellar hook-associated protein 3 FlgL
MTTIGTFAQTTQMQQYLSQLQNQENALDAQVSTGLVSPNFSGIAPQAATLVDLTSQKSQQQGYLNTITTVGTNLQTSSDALGDIETQIAKFSSSFTSSAYNTTGTSVQQEAQALLTEVGNDLNTQGSSGYIFSGSQTNTPAFNPSGLPNPPSLTAANTAYYQGDNNIQQATIDTGQTVPYGITANNPAFEQIIRSLNFIANSPPLSQSNPQDVSNVATASQLLTNGLQQLQSIQGKLGLQQSQLNNAQSQIQTTQALTTASISNIETVNPATAITELNTLQTQLQASYQTVNMLQQDSLVNYLK